MTDIQRFDPPGARFAGMSQAVRCGEWVIVSGQVALGDGKVVGIGDATAQARQCFANIDDALAAAGASLSDVVGLRCYLVAKAAYGGYAAVKNELFGDRPPASTTVVVNELLLPDLLMEIEATAWIGDRGHLENGGET
jgi:enamine deaminase RidA (YjgF/YER057c/UK114 family)